MTDILRFDDICAYCGARFQVTAEPVPVEPELQHYECPECGKAYDVEVTGTPRVRLVEPRTDGKHDRYQETMF